VEEDGGLDESDSKPSLVTDVIVQHYNIGTFLSRPRKSNNTMRSSVRQCPPGHTKRSNASSCTSSVEEDGGLDEIDSKPSLVTEVIVQHYNIGTFLSRPRKSNNTMRSSVLPLESTSSICFIEGISCIALFHGEKNESVNKEFGRTSMIGRQERTISSTVCCNSCYFLRFQPRSNYRLYSRLPENGNTGVTHHLGV
jgi:hypothetical protein